MVAAAAAAGFPVVPVPGASAPAALLSVAGLPGGRHLFVGFPPHRSGERRRWLEELSTVQETLVLMEAPTRIAATLSDLVGILGGERQAVVGRELTKMHEEILRGTLADLAAQVAVTTSVVDPREDFDINALGTFNVLEAVRACDAPPAVLFSSTNNCAASRTVLSWVIVGIGSRTSAAVR